jgi:hypothetical protein
MKKIILIFVFLIFAFAPLTAANDTIPPVNNNAEEEFIRLDKPAKSEQQTGESHVFGKNQKTIVSGTRNTASNYKSSKTTLRRGFELQGDFSLLFGEMETSYGANFTANYRFTPRFAFGVGFGSYAGWDTWSPVFTNVVFNFTDTKISPFLALEVGICSYSYSYNDYYSGMESDIDLYSGAVGGVQYSFNEHFALKANLKAAFGMDWIGFNIGFGIGAIYHF